MIRFDNRAACRFGIKASQLVTVGVGHLPLPVLLDQRHTGVVMEDVGLPPDLFSPTFASSRVIGWCANILEQAADNRIIRPSARYVGPPPPQPLPDR